MSIDKYNKIDYTRFDFVPFIMEAQGGIGDSAKAFVLELDKRKRQRMAALPRKSKNVKERGIANMDIIVALSLEIQRANAEYILQRLPRDVTLGVSEIRRCELSAIKVREEARRRIEDRKKQKLT